MAPSPKPPFRADQVGSLLRPQELRDAHERFLKGELAREALREIEDRSIAETVARQEALGLHAVTDGEFRRTSFHFDFLDELEGVMGKISSQTGDGGHAPNGKPKFFSPPTPSITGEVRHTHPIMLDSFLFLKEVAMREPKVTIPSPTMLLRPGRKGVSEEVYPDLADYRADVAKAYRTEIRLLGNAGCRYLQLDDTNFAYLCDTAMRETMREQRGEGPEAIALGYVDLINAALADRPEGMTICMHVCRGNLQSRWAAEGGYEPVAELMFKGVEVDGYFLEYDTDRAGGFEPLRFMPKGKRVVLGLVSSKSPELERKDDLKRRLDEAAKFVDLDDVCLSPQCGFASSFKGNAVTAEVQDAKLGLVVAVAEEVWGTAQ